MGDVIVLAPVAPCGAIVVDDAQRAPDCAPPHLQSGTLGEREFLAALTFDLTPLPRGAEVLYAGLELTGLDDRFLADQGSWYIRMIKLPADQAPDTLSFARLLAAPNALPNLVWRLRREQLWPGGRNTLQLEGDALPMLAARLGGGRVSFRFDGPTQRTNLFRWATQGPDAPRLRLAYVLPGEVAAATEIPLIMWDDGSTPP